MSLSKTWYTSANMALADTSTANRMAHSAMWAFGAMLLGYQSGTDGPEGARPGSVYWTLEGSSDSVTSGIDSTDRLSFSGAFTDSKWVRNTAGSAHTWFVIKSPSGLLDGPWYICMDFIGPTTDNICSFIVSNNVFSGGSTTARPTSTNESAITSVTYITTTAAAGKTHLTCDANGGFRFFVSRNGTGYFSTIIAMEPLVEYHSGDTGRTLFYTNYLDSGVGAMSDSSIVGGMRGRASDGTTALTTSNCSWLSPMHRFSGNNFSGLATTTNSLDSTVDALPSVYIYDSTTSKKGLRGRLPDAWWIGAQVSPGSTVPSTGSPERAVTGHFLTPFSVAPGL